MLGAAALLWGLPVPEDAALHITVGQHGDRRPHAGLVHHVSTVSCEVGVVAGIRVTRGVDLFREIATMLSLVDLVIAGDAMVRRGITIPQELLAGCLRARSSGARLALRAARLIRDRVDSPMETRLRLLIVLAGLPEPVVNPSIIDDSGRVRYRLDLCYPDLRLTIEYDGRQHRVDLDQWDHDIDRREWFARIITAIKLRGGSVPDRLDAEWTRHFPATSH